MDGGTTQQAGGQEELRGLTGLELVTGRLRQRPGGVCLLHGHSRVFPVSLLLGSALRQHVAVIDGAMRFNSYTISGIARFLGIPAADVLRRVHVTRSFTAYQTEAALRVKLPRFLAAHPCPLVIVLGLLDTYYDEQVKPHECLQSLRRIMATLSGLAADNIHVLIADVEIDRPPPGKEGLFPIVRNAADIIVRLDHSGYALHEERKPLPWDATTTRLRSSSTETGKHGASSGGR